MRKRMDLGGRGVGCRSLMEGCCSLVEGVGGMFGVLDPFYISIAIPVLYVGRVVVLKK